MTFLLFENLTFSYNHSLMLNVIQEKRSFRRRRQPGLFISLGCPRNLVDTEVMLGILLKAGYQAAQQLDEADFIVINTCGFLMYKEEKVGRHDRIELR